MAQNASGLTPGLIIRTLPSNRVTGRPAEYGVSSIGSGLKYRS
jgi:hypothetical protein